MKTKIITLALALFLFGSCASLLPKRESKFTPDKVELGMSKSDFLVKFGNPYKQNFFYNEKGEYCEVFFYRETLMVGEAFASEAIDMDTVFTFIEGKLVSQEQIQIFDYPNRCQNRHSNYQIEVNSED